MEKIIKIIQERVHAILQIEEISKKLSSICFVEIEKRKDVLINDLQNATWASFPIFNIDLSNGALINELVVTVYFYKNIKSVEENKVGGSYLSGSIEQITIDGIIKYNGSIALKIYNWDYKTNLQEQIKNVFNHELHHFFDDIVRFNKRGTTKMLNSVNKMTILNTTELLNKYPRPSRVNYHRC